MDAAILVYEAAYVVHHGRIAALAGARVRLAETEEFQETTQSDVIASIDLHIHHPENRHIYLLDSFYYGVGRIAALAGARVRLAETEELQETTQSDVIASIDLHIHHPENRHIYLLDSFYYGVGRVTALAGVRVRLSETLHKAPKSLLA